MNKRNRSLADLAAVPVVASFLAAAALADGGGQVPPGALNAYGAALIEPAISEGRSLQAQGRHGDAVRHLRRAIHLQRINGGLDSAAQLPLWEYLLESQLALGEHDAADVTQERLFRLRMRHAVDDGDRLRAASAYSGWKRERHLTGRGSRSFRNLLAMVRIHEAELERLRAASGGAPDRGEIPHLYRRVEAGYLISTYAGENSPTAHVHSGGAGLADYQTGTDLDAAEFRLLRKHNYRHGREAIGRIIEILEAESPPDVEALARARIALGDWHLWWHRRGHALASYRDAWNLYATDGDPETDPAALFPAPRALPDAAPLSTQRAPDPYTQPAQALVRFDVSRLGEARSIEFLELDPAEEPGARSALYKLLKSFRFRPVIADGEVVAANDVVRRYRYRY